MSTNILITPAEVRKIAGDFDAASQDAEKMRTTLLSQVQNTESLWDGRAADKFLGNYSQYDTTLQTYSMMLTTIARRLADIAVEMETADKSLSL